jgi:hypothetical protein
MVANVAGLALLGAFLGAAARGGGEAGRGEVFSVVEIAFQGPRKGPADAPARDVVFWARFRHEDGRPEFKVHGFWDGDGKGGAEGGVFKLRFCPTKAGRWDLVEVRSNDPALAGQKEGDHVAATASRRPGFWEIDPESPGGRWYRRSDGSHPYVFGNTHYNFLAGMRDGGRPSGNDIAADVAANAKYFKKLRFSLHGDRYPHTADKPFFDDERLGTDAGDFSHRPNPAWFHNRADRAVRAAWEHDLAADLIVCGPDTVEARSTLAARANGGDPSPWLRYLAARYGSYPNVWICLANEWDIQTPKYAAERIREAGRTIRGFLPYPTPLSVHGAPKNWKTELNGSPPWHDHYILQDKLKTIAAAADTMSRNHAAGGGDRPGVNDELGYEGAGDKFSEEDVIEGHLGVFLGGGYGSTGEKHGSKLGQYFWGRFDPAEHRAADNLGWLRGRIDSGITFWRMAPDRGIFPGADPGFRAMAWPGRECVLGTNKASRGIVAELPPGSWTAARLDVLRMEATVLDRAASGRFVFDAPEGRATLFHFKRNGD